MKILLLVLLLAITVPVFAGINELGGFAWTPVTKTYSTQGTASGAIVWTPASGKKIVLMGAILGNKNGTLPVSYIELESDFVTSGPTGGNGIDVIPAINISSGEIVISSGVPIWRGSAGSKLSITTNNLMTPSVTLWGYEE